MIGCDQAVSNTYTGAILSQTVLMPAEPCFFALKSLADFDSALILPILSPIQRPPLGSEFGD
jgi:hypothetical protein